MYYSLFGRYHYPGTRTCNCFPQKFKQQNNNIGQCNPPVQSNCPKQLTDKFCKDSLYIKSSAFGGFILPEGTEKGATLHVASLNLNTLNHEDFVVQLNFSCNIITSKIKLRLRFQLFKQEKGQCLPTLSVPAYYITGTRKVPRQIVLPYRHMIVIRKPVHAATIAPV